MARLYQQKIREGIDPTTNKASHTVTTAIETFIEWKEQGGQAPATIRKYRECLANNIEPTIGHIGIADLDTKTAADLIEKLRLTRHRLLRSVKSLIHDCAASYSAWLEATIHRP